MILYIVHEYPSYSQTFVEREIAAVREQGREVGVYALRPTPPTIGTYEGLNPLVPSRASVTLLLWSALTAPWAFIRGLCLFRGFLAGPREWSRVILASMHAARLLRYISRRRLAIHQVHAHFAARPADVGIIVGYILGAPVSITAHASDVYASREPHLLQVRLQRSALVACASHSVERTVKGLYPQARTALVRCGVDLERLPASDPKHGRIVTVARLVSTKGVFVSVRAAALLARRGVDFHWKIVGEGPERGRLEEFVRRNGLDKHVHFTGALKNSAALEEISAAEVFVLPCQRSTEGESDGIPVALMEAMALRVPVVTSPVGGIVELVEHGRTGYLVPEGDFRAVADMIAFVLSSDQRRLAERARFRIQHDYSAAREASRLLQALDSFRLDPAESQ